MISFLKSVFNHFLKSDTLQKGATLAYYAVFSLFPIIIIVTSLFGIFLGEKAVSGEIHVHLKDILGSDAATQIQDIIKNQHINHNNILTTIIGFGTLVFSASGMFSQTHNAFNSIWGIEEKSKSNPIKYFTKHLVSFTILIFLFFIIVISTTLNSLLIKYTQDLHVNFKFFYVYEHIASFLVLSIIFSIMFKFLGDAKVQLKPAILGGLFTALLFIFGKAAIGFYIGHIHISTTFGSASLLALLMLWVYYTSQIIFLGASFVKVISEKLGCEIIPGKNAVMIKESHKK